MTSSFKFNFLKSPKVNNKNFTVSRDAKIQLMLSIKTKTKS